MHRIPGGSSAKSEAIRKQWLNPRPTKGGGYHPPYGLSPAAQKRKRK